MMLRFDNPAWYLMAVALLPLLIHLVARRRPRERRFSSIDLLRELVRLQTRRARPKDWFLLVLRTLAVGSLAAAFLLPLLGGGEGEGGRALVIVLDNTASMAASDGQQQRMAQALAVAEQAVKALHPGDRVNLVTLAGVPHPLFDKPESAPAMALRELARTQSQQAACANLADALVHAAGQLRDLPPGVQGELLIISDFQETEWTLPYSSLLPDIPTRFVSVAQAEELENSAVTGLSLTPARPLPGQDVTATVHVERFGGSGESTLTVGLAAGDLRLSQPCRIPASGKAEVSFRLAAPQQAGDWLLEARLDADRFPADDRRAVAVSIADKLDCQAITTDPAQLGFLLRALEHIPFLRTAVAPALTGAASDFIVWNGPTKEDVPTIRERLQAGTTVLARPDRARDSATRPLLTGEDGDCPGALLTDGSHWKLTAAADDEAFRLFAGTDLSGLWDSAIYSRTEGIPCPENADVLLRYEDGPPALIRQAQGAGTLLVWNMPVIVRDNRAGFSPLFLPVLAEVLRHSRSGDAEAAQLQAGLDYPSLPLPRGAESADIHLRNAKGEELPTWAPPQRAGQPATVQGVDPAMPGSYEWYRGDTLLARLAVPFPTIESPLRRLPEGVLPQAPDKASEHLEASTGQGVRELWPWCLAAALAFFLLELALCRGGNTKPTTAP